MSGVFDDHLSLDVVVAYADGEMSMTAYQRAAAHVMKCPSCAADVAEQTAASQYLRQAQVPTMPGSLFDALKSIPIAVPQAGPVPGVMVDSASGRTVRTPDNQTQGRGRRFRLGAGALVAGLAVGAVVVVSASEHPVGPVVRPTQPDTAAVSRPASSRQAPGLDVLARSTR
jgi:anti-sigma factor RsiW